RRTTMTGTGTPILAWRMATVSWSLVPTGWSPNRMTRSPRRRAGSAAGARGGAAGSAPADRGAGAASEPVALDVLRAQVRVGVHPEERHPDRLTVDQSRRHLQGLVDRDGEPDPGVGLGVAVGGDRGRDADDLAAGVGQRPAGVARVDGGVGLDGVDQLAALPGPLAVGHLHHPVQGR